MLEEKNCLLKERYLCATFLLSDNAIKLWKQNTVKRFQQKSEEYHKYINWNRSENEVAVFSLYAYADLKLNKKFEIIFDIDNPERFVLSSFYIRQSIFEGWGPIETIAHGHKHLLILEFDKDVPDLIYKLYREDNLISTLPKGYSRIGFCNEESFEQIRLGTNPL